MKVIIQSLKSQLHLAPQGRWTSNVTQANDFGVTTRAYNAARQITSGPFRVVLHLPETSESIPFIEGTGRAVLDGGGLYD